MKNLIDCTSSELDFFSEQPIENIIRESQYQKIEPLVKSDSQLTFEIAPSQMFLDLSKSSVSIKIKITAEDGTELNNDSKVGPVNNLFHSIIKQATVYINNTEIENSDDGYHLRAITTSSLNHGIDAKNSFLQSCLFIPDTPGQMENYEIPKAVKPEDAKTPQVFNYGFLKRRELLLNGKGIIELKGIPECDIFTNGKFLLNQQKFTLNLKFNDPKLFLMGQGNYKMSILSANFWAKKVLPNDNIQHSVALNLEKKFAVYNTNSVKVVIHKLKMEGSSETVSVITGLLPKRVVFAMVDYEAVTVGKMSKNPYFFDHFKLKSFDLRENGTSAPYSHALEFDFEKNEYMDGYWTLFEGIDKPFLGNCISREDYAKGNTFLAFDMTPNGECEPFRTTSKNGTLTARLTWNEVPSNTVALVCFMEFNNSFRVDKERNIVKAV